MNLHLNMRNERITAVVKWLRTIAKPVAEKTEYSRWIAARNADPDQSLDWCYECGSAEVDRLNALNPDHEYLLDGGWGSETDSPPYCCRCEKELDDQLTDFGIRAEIEHYDTYSVSLRGKCAAPRAFRFLQMLESGSFMVDDSDHWRFFRKLERMCERRAASGA